MNLLIVTYDLSDPSHEEAVLKYIKARTDWAKLCNSSYLIWTNKDPSTVRDDLSRITENSIVSFICPASKPWASYGIPKKASNLLREHL